AWVPGLAALPFIALAAALSAGLSALAQGRTRSFALAGSVLLCILICGRYAGAPAFAGLPSLRSGNVLAADAVIQLLLAVLLCADAVWASLAVLLWRRPLLGVMPMAATVAVNILN